MQMKTEKSTMNQQQEYKKAKTLVTTVNQETIRQPYLPSCSMEAIISVLTEARKLKMVQALLDSGVDDDQVDSDLFKDDALSRWLNRALHQKKVIVTLEKNVVSRAVNQSRLQ